VKKQTKIVLRIEQTKRTPKRFRWTPSVLYPTFAIDKTHGWITLIGFSIKPGKENAIPSNYLADAIDAWRREYGPSWSFLFQSWSRNGAGGIAFPC
jgi:energy-converting hydrogenase Eha subunit A